MYHILALSMNSVLLDDYPDLKIYSGTQFNERWYKRIRDITKQRFELKCLDDGTDLINSDPEMTKTDLDILNRLLLGKGSVSASEHRAVINIQFYTMGRVSEPITLNSTGLKFSKSDYSSVFDLDLYRKKRGVKSTINIVLNAKSYLRCPVHSIACMRACYDSTSKKLFPTLSQCRNIAAFVNKLLSTVYEEYDKTEREAGDWTELTKDL